MANISSILNNLDNTLTDLIKADIKSKGLISTGKLYDSINVKSTYGGNGIELSLEAEDYFEFVDNKNNIMKDVLDSPKWNRALEDELFAIVDTKINEKI